ADSIQPGAAKRRQESLPTRLEGSEHSAEGLRLSGGALHHPGAEQSGSRARTAPDGAGRRRAPVARVFKPRWYARPANSVTGGCRRIGKRREQNGERRRPAMIDLTTKYLGLTLKN